MLLSCYNVYIMEFQSWITQKYLEWRADKIGNAGSLRKFAKLIGIAPQTLNGYLNGGRAPEGPTVKVFADYFGAEVYSVLGLADPNELSAQEILRTFGMEEPLIEALLAARARYSAELASRGIEANSPEGREIIKRELEGLGLDFTVKE